jgi:hypothetical protein
VPASGIYTVSYTVTPKGRSQDAPRNTLFAEAW